MTPPIQPHEYGKKPIQREQHLPSLPQSNTWFASCCRRHSPSTNDTERDGYSQQVLWESKLEKSSNSKLRLRNPVITSQTPTTETTATSSGSTAFRLTHTEVPECMRHPFILTGYRYGEAACYHWKNVIHWHNDTLNIWTHLLGFILVLYIVPGLYQELPSGTSWVDKLIFGEYVFSVLLCLALSTLYHLFRAGSADSYTFWYRMDILGICILIASSYIICTWIAFRNELVYFFIYNSVVLTGLLITIWMAIHPHYKATKFDKIRAVVMASVVAFGVIPVTHWIVSHSNNPDEETPSAWVPPLLMFGFYGIGFLIFYTHFPERFWPGRFDHLASSHQLWHLFVVTAALSWLYGMHWHLQYLVLKGYDQ